MRLIRAFRHQLRQNLGCALSSRRNENFPVAGWSAVKQCSYGKCFRQSSRGRFVEIPVFVAWDIRARSSDRPIRIYAHPKREGEHGYSQHDCRKTGRVIPRTVGVPVTYRYRHVPRPSVIGPDHRNFEPSGRVTLWIFEVTELGLCLLDPPTIGRRIALEPEVVAKFLGGFGPFPEISQGGAEVEANSSIVGTKVK